jgi:hypothetical protein
MGKATKENAPPLWLSLPGRKENEEDIHSLGQELKEPERRERRKGKFQGDEIWPPLMFVDRIYCPGAMGRRIGGRPADD